MHNKLWLSVGLFYRKMKIRPIRQFKWSNDQVMVKVFNKRVDFVNIK